VFDRDDMEKVKLFLSFSMWEGLSLVCIILASLSENVPSLAIRYRFEWNLLIGCVQNTAEGQTNFLRFIFIHFLIDITNW